MIVLIQHTLCTPSPRIITSYSTYFLLYDVLCIYYYLQDVMLVIFVLELTASIEYGKCLTEPSAYVAIDMLTVGMLRNITF